MGRVSKKRSDRRWQADDGTIWASKFEYEVYNGLKRRGYLVRKCEQGEVDTFSYYSTVRGGECPRCGHNEVIQRRTYTPDLFISAAACVDGKNHEGIYIETKGYFSAEKRKLLRDFQKTGPGITLFFLAERDNWVTKGKSRYSDYFSRYLKTIPFAVWNGQDLPEDWQEIIK
jgi:hypothetical protein